MTGINKKEIILEFLAHEFREYNLSVKDTLLSLQRSIEIQQMKIKNGEFISAAERASSREEGMIITRIRASQEIFEQLQATAQKL